MSLSKSPCAHLYLDYALRETACPARQSVANEMSAALSALVSAWSVDARGTTRTGHC